MSAHVVLRARRRPALGAHNSWDAVVAERVARIGDECNEKTPHCCGAFFRLSAAAGASAGPGPAGQRWVARWIYGRIVAGAAVAERSASASARVRCACTGGAHPGETVAAHS